MHINFGFFQFVNWKRYYPNDWIGNGCWFRIFGWGLHFTNGEETFSERQKLVKTLKLPFGYRVKCLKRGK